MKKELISVAILAILSLFAPVFGQKPDFFKKNAAALPVAVCKENLQVAIDAGQNTAFSCQSPSAGSGTAHLLAADLDEGSYDPLGQPLFFKIKKTTSVAGPFEDALDFGCGEIGVAIDVILRVFDLDPGAGAVADSAFAGHFSDCLTSVSVVDKMPPTCQAPPSLTISCEKMDPLPWSGALQFSDNCGIASIDTSFEYLPSEQDFFQKKYGLARRIFTVTDCSGNASTAVQEITVDYREQFRVQFPDDLKTTECANFSGVDVQIEANNCENIGVSHEDQVFLIVPDACLQITRFHKVVNLATYNPALPEVFLTNTPNSNQAPAIWIGGNADNQWAWALVNPDLPNSPTVGERLVNFPEPLSDTLSQKGSPAIVYPQIIKIDDATPPTALPADYTYCQVPPNDPNQWNENMPCNYWGLSNTWDPIDQSHDLREAVVDLSLIATDACSGDDVNFRFLLFLDLNGDGVMETTINSENPTWGFGLRENELTTINGVKYRIARITRDVEMDNCAPPFNFQKIPNFTLPKGNHKIKWIVEDRCGNDYTKEYPINVGKCAPPSLICHNYLKINQLVQWAQTGDPAATRFAKQFVKAASDNNNPVAKLEFALRDPGINPGTGFPKDALGKPVKSLTWGCGHLGLRPLELWVRDLEGNTATCPTAVSIVDGTKLCPMDSLGQPQIDFRGAELTGLGAAGGFELYQNQPNPFSETTEIGFNLPADGAAVLRVFDALGRFVFEKNGQFEAGYNSFFLEKNDFAESRVLGFYQVLTADGSAARRFVFEKN